MGQPDGFTVRVATRPITFSLTADGHLDEACAAAMRAGRLETMNRACPACLSALLRAETGRRTGS
jgi:hypothetical protein